MLDLRLKGLGFEPHRGHCIVFFSIFVTLKPHDLGHDLPDSVNERVNSPFYEGFYLHKTLNPRRFMKIKSSRKFPNLQYMTASSGEVIVLQSNWWGVIRQNCRKG